MRSVDALQTEAVQCGGALAPVPPEILDQHDEFEWRFVASRKAIIERALDGELTHHLGYRPGGARPDDTINHRNGRERQDRPD
jgi:hypothetical protein